MKKALILLTLICSVISCRKEPDMSDMDGRYFTCTNYDASADFSSYDTYFIPDSILIVGDNEEPVYAKNDAARKIIATFVSRMDSCGYTRADEIGKADLGLQLSYIEQTRYFLDYAGSTWWWGYPGYWDPFFWGDWGYWGYPYPITFSYSSHSLLAEMVELNAPQGAEEKLPILWTSFIGGEQNSYFYNLHAMMDGIEQVFEQSPYLQR